MSKKNPVLNIVVKTNVTKLPINKNNPKLSPDTLFSCVSLLSCFSTMIIFVSLFDKSQSISDSNSSIGSFKRSLFPLIAYNPLSGMRLKYICSKQFIEVFYVFKYICSG